LTANFLEKILIKNRHDDVINRCNGRGQRLNLSCPGMKTDVTSLSCLSIFKVLT